MLKKQIRCNACGRELRMKHGLLMEDAFEARKEWGYFSRRDLEMDAFVMCEDCYEKMISAFVIPVEVRKKYEVM